MSSPDNDDDDERRARDDADTLGVLERRAALLRRPLPAADLGAGALVATFSLDAELFAFPLESMRATIPLRLVTPVPLAAAHVLGVVRYERSILPVLSLPALLGDRAWRRDPTVLVVVEIERGALLAIDCAEIPVPASLAVISVDRDATSLTVKAELSDGRAVALLDLERLGERARRHVD